MGTACRSVGLHNAGVAKRSLLSTFPLNRIKNLLTLFWGHCLVLVKDKEMKRDAMMANREFASSQVTRYGGS